MFASFAALHDIVNDTQSKIFGRFTPYKYIHATERKIESENLVMGLSNLYFFFFFVARFVFCLLVACSFALKFVQNSDIRTIIYLLCLNFFSFLLLFVNIFNQYLIILIFSTHSVTFKKTKLTQTFF